MIPKPFLDLFNRNPYGLNCIFQHLFRYPEFAAPIINLPRLFEVNLDALAKKRQVAKAFLCL